MSTSAFNSVFDSCSPSTPLAEDNCVVLFVLMLDVGSACFCAVISVTSSSELPYTSAESWKSCASCFFLRLGCRRRRLRLAVRFGSSSLSGGPPGGPGPPPPPLPPPPPPGPVFPPKIFRGMPRPYPPPGGAPGGAWQNRPAPVPAKNGGGGLRTCGGMLNGGLGGGMYGGLTIGGRSGCGIFTAGGIASGCGAARNSAICGAGLCSCDIGPADGRGICGCIFAVRLCCMAKASKRFCKSSYSCVCCGVFCGAVKILWVD